MQIPVEVSLIRSIGSHPLPKIGNPCVKFAVIFISAPKELTNVFEIAGRLPRLVCA